MELSIKYKNGKTIKEDNCTIITYLPAVNTLVYFHLDNNGLSHHEYAKLDEILDFDIKDEEPYKKESDK